MIQRCTKPGHKGFKYYGARGIRVCDRWMESFGAFLSDMGAPPSAIHSLDRLNPDGNYEPGNVRWATPAEQARNKRRSQRPSRIPHHTTRCIGLARKVWPSARLVRCTRTNRNRDAQLCFKHAQQLARLLTRALR